MAREQSLRKLGTVLERATHPGRGHQRSLSKLVRQRAIINEACDEGVQILDGPNAPFALSVEKNPESVVEILCVGARDHRRAQPRRLERILSSVRNQTSAEKRERRGAVEKAELAQRVRDIDFRCGLGQRASRAQLRSETTFSR